MNERAGWWIWLWWLDQWYHMEPWYRELYLPALPGYMRPRKPAGVAQLAERPPCTRGVAGSNPAAGSGEWREEGQ